MVGPCFASALTGLHEGGWDVCRKRKGSTTSFFFWLNGELGSYVKDLLELFWVLEELNGFIALRRPSGGDFESQISHLRFF